VFCVSEPFRDNNDWWGFVKPVESEVEMFIQWKGTDLCMDFWCQCGASCHFDGDFAYAVQCPHCRAIYELGTQVVAKRADATTHTPRMMEPDEDLADAPN
jgi:hypothetical protein